MRNGSPHAGAFCVGRSGSAPAPSAWLLLLPALALRSLTREVQEVTAGDTLVYATGDQAGLPVDVAAIEPVMAVQVFPQGKSDNERNLIELVRLAADLPAGLVAYSAICTHLGCTVLPQAERAGLHRLPVPRQRVRSRGRRAGSSAVRRTGPCQPCPSRSPGWGRAGRRWIRGTGRTGLMVALERDLPGAPR